MSEEKSLELRVSVDVGYRRHSETSSSVRLDEPSSRFIGSFQMPREVNGSKSRRQSEGQHTV